MLDENRANTSVVKEKKNYSLNNLNSQILWINTYLYAYDNRGTSSLSD